VASVSADLKRHIVAEGFSQNQVAVIYNGIEVGPLPTPELRARVRRDLGVSDDTIVVGTVARLDPVKDLDTLITALGHAHTGPRLMLLVIGDGQERARLETLARGQTQFDARFLGHRDDARDLLAGFDIYANSSIHEGVSLTILEGMAAGLPVIATTVGGNPEVIDASCGRLVPPRSPDAIASAIVELGSNRALRVRLGESGRRRVEDRFRIERMVADYAVLYTAGFARQASTHQVL
jgi:glycosyltransferase involved in cell wall biosynthesis